LVLAEHIKRCLMWFWLCLRCDGRLITFFGVDNLSVMHIVAAR